jgi:hypothetical protein
MIYPKFNIRPVRGLVALHEHNAMLERLFREPIHLSTRREQEFARLHVVEDLVGTRVWPSAQGKFSCPVAVSLIWHQTQFPMSSS